MKNIHEVSNPYFNGVKIIDRGLIIEWAVDQLWIDPDTNTEQILTEYYTQELEDEQICM